MDSLTARIQSDPSLRTGCNPRQRAAFLDAYPGYARTRSLDSVRAAEYPYLDASGQVYLDYTGAGLPALSQLDAHTARLRGGCFGNPHSENPASAASTALIDRARGAVLGHLNASPDEYAVIFTQNASSACRLVGEAYAFGPGGRFVLTSDNHNSVNGIREFARARGARTEYIPLRPADLRADDESVRRVLSPDGAERPRPGLFAFPAQSNFSGVQHPLRWIDLAHERGYDVLLDAAAYLPANRLDLSQVHPDFVPVSWYKVFGYPTGVGCLVARREALARLQRPWFAGGTIAVASVLGDWHTLADDEAGFEDGTPSFQHIPDVEYGLSWVRQLNLDVIHERVTCLTGWLLRRLLAARHGNGAPLVRVHGPRDTAGRGGTVAFSVLAPDGRLADARAVAREAAIAGISIRTGCFCNPGAAEAAFGLTRSDVVEAAQLGAISEDAYQAATGIPGGALRASVGPVSSIDDVEALVTLIETTFGDRPADEDGPLHRLEYRSLVPA
jgi:selenocysteine lyase/cysteine desulfurase